MMPRITLEQWRALLAVVDAGGYAQAAEKLHKSQSAVTYAVQKLENLLNVKVFELVGRKAVLTSTGALLYRRAQLLLDDAQRIESSAQRLSAGWEPELRLAAEIIMPNKLLLAALARFGQESPHTRVEWFETVLGGTAQALLEGQVDLAIMPRMPPGFAGEILLRMRAIAVAHPEHPLHALGRPLTMRDLKRHRNIVVRDSGSARDPRAMNVEAEQRWVVSSMSTCIQAVAAGHGFAWLMEDKISEELERGLLKPLPMGARSDRHVDLYLVLADPEFAGPGVLRLAQILRESALSMCPRSAEQVAMLDGEG